MSLRAALRQLGYAKEFRIASPVWPGEEALLSLDAVFGELAGEMNPPGDQDSLLADVGTGLWRLRGRLFAPEAASSPETLRYACRHVESTWDIMTEAGVQVVDYTGQAMPEGGVPLHFEVLASQPTSGLAREEVIQTIRPTIYFQGRLIQRGRVVTGTPIAIESSAESLDRSAAHSTDGRESEHGGEQ